MTILTTTSAGTMPLFAVSVKLHTHRLAAAPEAGLASREVAVKETVERIGGKIGRFLLAGVA